MKPLATGVDPQNVPDHAPPGSAARLLSSNSCLQSSHKHQPVRQPHRCFNDREICLTRPWLLPLADAEAVWQGQERRHMPACAHRHMVFPVDLPHHRILSHLRQLPDRLMYWKELSSTQWFRDHPLLQAGGDYSRKMVCFYCSDPLIRSSKAKHPVFSSSRQATRRLVSWHPSIAFDLQSIDLALKRRARLLRQQQPSPAGGTGDTPPEPLRSS